MQILQAKLYIIIYLRSFLGCSTKRFQSFDVSDCWTCMVLRTADYGVRYVVHVLRIGEAITLSLKGSVGAKDDFHEMRHWQYQSKNSDWHLAC